MLPDYLLAIIDVQSLDGSSVQHTPLQVEVTAGAVGFDGADGRLDAGGATLIIGDVAFVAQILEACMLTPTNKSNIDTTNPFLVIIVFCVSWLQVSLLSIPRLPSLGTSRAVSGTR